MNPFTPTFGVTPPVLAGRERQTQAFGRALRNGPGDPVRAALITGIRGAGKTVLLNAFEDRAGAAGWAVVSTTLRPGTVAQLTDAILPALLAKHDPGSVHSSVVGGSVSVLGVGGGLTRQTERAFPVRPDFRLELEALARALAAKRGGVFLSLDEVHRGQTDELREIFHAVQHAFRQGLDVACVAAGLPSGIDALLNDDVLTFLRRAERFDLGRLTDMAVVQAIQEPIANTGRAIAPEALQMAVQAVRGYPFLTQVVGFHLWEADPSVKTITAAHAKRVIPEAQAAAARLVFEPILAELSGRDVDFLRAMAASDQDPVPVSEIGLRLPAGNASQYRLRLIAAEVIEPAGRGKVRFTLPGLREHLRPSAPDTAA